MSSTRTPSPIENLSNNSPPPIYHVQDENRYQRIRQTMQTQIPTIQTIFGPGYTVELKDELDDTSFYIRDQERKICLRFESINANDGKIVLYVDNINKCQGLKGEEVVAKTIQIARDPVFNADLIKLYDASIVHPNPQDPSCHFSLYILKILTTGQSWYNQYGFFYDPETEDQEEYERNNQIRNMTLQQLFTDIVLHTPYFSSTIIDLQNTVIFQMYHHVRVQDFAKQIENTFVTMQRHHTTDCTSPLIQWYLRFLNLVEECNIINYGHSLEYNVKGQQYTGIEIETGGAKSKRNKRNKRNNQKRKSRKAKRNKSFTVKKYLKKRTKYY